jgi:hypothetical protein
MIQELKLLPSKCEALCSNPSTAKERKGNLYTQTQGVPNVEEKTS